jgi:hypothetical protein
MVYQSFYVEENIVNNFEFTERYNRESSNSYITSKALLVVNFLMKY